MTPLSATVERDRGPVKPPQPAVDNSAPRTPEPGAAAPRYALANGGALAVQRCQSTARSSSIASNGTARTRCSPDATMMMR